MDPEDDNQFEHLVAICSYFLLQRHKWWLSLSPDQRAMHIGLPTTGQTVPLQLPLLEATMRAELLNNVLPERVETTAMQKGATTVLDLLLITFHTY